jgi:hypothetical protein
MNAFVQQQAGFFFGLDAFGNRFQSERPGEVDQCSDKPKVFRVFADLANERSVDLDLVNSELLEVME